MRKIFLYGLLFVLFSVCVFAKHGQLDWSVTDLRCGDGVRDKYELFDLGDDDNLCDVYASLLGIAAVGDKYHCTCLPRIIPAFCGNNIREGAELCDGTDEDDFCPALGEAMGVELVCNPETCGCSFVDPIPDSYRPGYLDFLEELAEAESVCGDKIVQGFEECDPPGSLCRTVDGEIGECSEDCFCVVKGFSDPENDLLDFDVNDSNVSDSVVVDSVDVGVVSEDVDDSVEVKTSVFKKILRWIIDLFS